jgi:hypothetical protein
LRFFEPLRTLPIPLSFSTAGDAAGWLDEGPMAGPAAGTKTGARGLRPDGRDMLPFSFGVHSGATLAPSHTSDD